MDYQVLELLQTLSTDKSHPFYELFKDKLLEEGTVLRTFSRKEKVIINDTNNYLENLGRELIVLTMIGDESQHYIEEDTTSNKKRPDLMAQYFENTAEIIIEFKNYDKGVMSDKKIDEEVTAAFNQIQKRYIDNQSYIKKDIFTVVVFTDVKTLINKETSINFEKYLTLSPQEKSNERYKLFNKYGIYIETRKYDFKLNRILKEYSDPIWFDIPKLCITEILDQEDEFGQKSAVSRVKDAINLPSSSGEFGIKNVRDIKDPNFFISKRTLIKDIFTTCLEGYKKQDNFYIAKNSKEKDFVFMESDSIISSQKRISGGGHVFISTLNGAIVDGQNSLHSLKIIIDFLKLLAVSHNNHFSSWQKDLANILKDFGYKTLNDFQQILRFIESSYIYLQITKATNVQEARLFAINKNNTIQVSSDEKTISKNIEKIQVISNELLLQKNWVVRYPKKRNVGISDLYFNEYGIFADDLAHKYYIWDKSWVGALEKEPSKFNNLLKIITKFTGKEDRASELKNIQTSITHFCDYFTGEIEDNPSDEEKKHKENITKIKTDIEHLKNKKKQIEKALEKANNQLEFHTSQLSNFDGTVNLEQQPELTLIRDGLMINYKNSTSSVQELENEINDIEIEINDKKEEQKLETNHYSESTIIKYRSVNQNELFNFLESIFLLRKHNIEIKTNLFKSDDHIKSFIFFMIIYAYDINFKNENLNNKILDWHIEKIADKTKKLLDHLKITYPKLEMTTLRNAENGIVNDNLNNTVDTSIIREYIFKYYKDNTK